ncbi:MAG: valine--tRNA ligase, partial [Elusimicrobiota bacterium]|nr:valine--tRNA ligase [Elusimicrobiota bacterium]
PYTIVIPPPNVTGVLHMGHALNNVLQDILIRVHKIKGRNPMWMPGTDHGGIATQNVVERKLLAENKTRHDLGREKFLEKVWRWKDETGGTIIKQLKRLGCGCDWQRLAFTMDEGRSAAVNEAFIRLYNKGLIYRGEYMTNRCPRCETALSDIEVKHRQKRGSLWYIKYPFKEDSSKFAIVATTRPETMLGDTAVAVNPDDRRYKDLVGKKIILPLAGREIEIIEDGFVDPEFGTGMVKVTPAHDPNDFEMGRRHNLEFIKVIGNDARMTEEAGVEFKGMTREECRREVIKKLKEKKFLKDSETYTHSVGECYRCSTEIEPLMSRQWFVKMKPLAEKALESAEKGEIKFTPRHWEKPYINWLENLHDWCISRQIWWGHRFPVYYCGDREEKGCEPMVAKTAPAKCPNCGGTDIFQEEDVLDTWFSSALWPFSTLGWPRRTPELKYYYPTQVLVTGHEILYLWVARMVMMGLEMMGEVPFENVNIHGIIRDSKGNKMSKSMGNVIDPMDIINQYGTDALRFAIAKAAVPGRDIQIDDDDFKSARNFCNKIWNATRLILSNIDIDKLRLPEADEMELADKWILSELNNFAQMIEKSYLDYNNANTARLIYDFTWKYYCDWYLETAKLRLYSEDKKEKEIAQNVLLEVLLRLLSLMHPVMPFISSQLWEYIAGELDLDWKDPMGINGFTRRDYGIDASETEKMNKLMEIVSGIRNIRGETNIDPSVKLAAGIKAAGSDLELVKNHTEYLTLLAGLEKVEAGPDIKREPGAAVTVAGSVTVYISLPEKLKKEEIKRLKKQIEEIRGYIAKNKKKLENKGFVENAPEDIISGVKEKTAGMDEKITKLEKNLKEMEK